MSTDVDGDGWYLQTRGRRFGPLTEGELRGYFRAGMVHDGDTVTRPGDPRAISATEVAALLQESAPVAAPAKVAAPFTAIIHDTPPSEAEVRAKARWMGPVAALVAAVVLLYFGLSMMRRIQPPQRPGEILAAATKELEASNDRPPVAGPRAISTSPAAIASGTSPSVASGAASADARVDWSGLAEQFSRNSDWAGLAAHATRWSLAEPQRDSPWLFLGIAHARRNETAQAIAALDKVLQANPTHLEARSVLADVYLQSGRNDDAATLLAELVKAQPDDARLWNNLGSARFSLGQNAEAIVALETAVRLDPAFRQAWGNLATAYQKAGMTEQASAARANAGSP